MKESHLKMYENSTLHHLTHGGHVLDVLNGLSLSPLLRHIGNSDLGLTGLDLSLELIKSRVDVNLLPRPLAALEDVIHLLKGKALGLEAAHEHVAEGNGVEGSELLQVC